MLAVLFLGALCSAPPGVVAVFDVRDERPADERSDDNTLTSLTTYLGTLLTKSGRYRVVPTAELQRALRDAKRDSLSECYDERCQIEIGKAVAAQMSLETAVGRVGTSCVMTSRLFDLREETMIRAASYRGECSDDALTNGLESVVNELVTGRSPSPAPLMSAQLSLSLSGIEGTRAAFAGDDDAWRAHVLRVKSRLDDDDVKLYLDSGLTYALWAERTNDASESLALEIVKWVTTGLSVVAIGVLILDPSARDSGSFWLPTTAVGFAPAALSWSFDLMNIGDVPTDL